VHGSRIASPIKMTEHPSSLATQETDYQASASSATARGSRIGLHPPRKAINIHRPWEGPLPALRISPKWSLGDPLQKAMVMRSNPSFSSVFRGTGRSDHARR
jgi:hypothetical protein